MKITLSDAALNRIQPLLDDDTVVLLNYDDGVGPYSHHGLVALQVAFNLILITKSMNRSDYDAAIDSNIGTIYVKNYSKRFLGEDMVINFKPGFNLMPLTDESEEIEENLQIVDLRNSKA